MTTTLQATPDTTRISRRQVLAAITLQVDLPAPESIAFWQDTTTVSIELDRVADLHAWLPYFGITAKAVHAQPYTHKSGPEKGQTTTLANAYNRDGWHGWTVHLTALDPVGQPEPALDDATREQLQTIANSSAAHYQTAGWGGVPGECGVECACGTTFGHFDTIAEAAALLDDHIAASNNEPATAGAS